MAGAGPDPDLQGLIAYTAMGPQARVVPVTVFQGDADDTVAAASGDRVVRQWLATTRRASNGATPPPDFAHPDLVRDGRAPGGLPFSVRTWQDAHGTPLLEYWVVSGLGHAWSGGAAGGAFSDPRGPSATHAMLGFFSHHRLPATAVPVRHRWLPGLRARRARTDGIAA
jgi:poly(3-hydroxybutyrate) depolymerase